MTSTKESRPVLSDAAIDTKSLSMRTISTRLKAMELTMPKPVEKRQPQGRSIRLSLMCTRFLNLRSWKQVKLLIHLSRVSSKWVMTYQRLKSTTLLKFLNNKLIEVMSKVCLNRNFGSSTTEASLRLRATIRITVFHRSARMEAYCHLLNVQQTLEIKEVMEKLAALDLGCEASDQLWIRQMAGGREINWFKTQVSTAATQTTQPAMFT